MVWSCRAGGLVVWCCAVSGGAFGEELRLPDPGTRAINVEVPPIASDASVKVDYDIVYVRARRAGDKVHKRFYTDFSQPVTMEAGADLMLLHPNGDEELLVPGGEGSITDPVVSFDGRSVYYVHLYDLQKPNQWEPSSRGADIFKIHLASRRIVRLTNQRFAPNTGAARGCHWRWLWAASVLEEHWRVKPLASGTRLQNGWSWFRRSREFSHLMMESSSIVPFCSKTD